MKSIFSLLWKQKDSCEDFRTEILAWVLKYLQNNNLLNKFFDDIGVQIGELKEPSITTQRGAAGNIFDILISDNDHITIFENKWDSPTHLGQLQEYDKFLQTRSQKHKILIHVTKWYSQPAHNFSSKFYPIPWGRIYECLSTIKDDIGDDELIHQFLLFLEEEGIAMKKVSWEIINGAKSIYSLTRIIQRACDELNLKHEWKSCSADYTQQCIDGKIVVYFIFKEAKLYFGVFSDTSPSEELTTSVGWWPRYHCICFDFDEYYFFHRDLEGQVEAIKDFIKRVQSLIHNTIEGTEVEQ